MPINAPYVTFQPGHAGGYLSNAALVLTILNFASGLSVVAVSLWCEIKRRLLPDLVGDQPSQSTARQIPMFKVDASIPAGHTSFIGGGGEGGPSQGDHGLRGMARFYFVRAQTERDRPPKLIVAGPEL